MTLKSICLLWKTALYGNKIKFILRDVERETTKP